MLAGAKILSYNDIIRNKLAGLGTTHNKKNESRESVYIEIFV